MLLTKDLMRQRNQLAFAQNDNITMSGEKRRQRVRMCGGHTKVETIPSSVKKGKFKINHMKATIIPFCVFFAQMVFWRQP